MHCNKPYNTIMQHCALCFIACANELIWLSIQSFKHTSLSNMSDASIYVIMFSMCGISAIAIPHHWFHMIVSNNVLFVDVLCNTYSCTCIVSVEFQNCNCIV